MKKLAASIFLISICSVTNAEVYQCKVGGNLVFQDKPCTGAKNTGTIGDRVKEQNAKTKKEADIDKQEQLRRQKWSVESKKAQKEFNSLPFPYVGMSLATKSVWGEPTSKNISKSAKGTNEQWVYRSNNGKAKYLYFTNGILTTISE